MKNKKTMLIASDCFLPRWDGVSRFLSEIIPKLEEDYNIVLLVPGFGTINRKKYGLDKIKIIKIPTIKIKFGDIYFAKPELKKIKKAISESDIVFTQTIGPIGLISIKYGKKLNKAVVSFIHSIEWLLARNSIKWFKRTSEFIVKIIARKAYNKSSLLIVPSEETAKKLDSAGIRTKKKIVYLATDTEKFRPMNKDEAKKSIGIDKDFFIVGYNGRISREKDLLTLYRAFRKVEKKYEKTKLMIVGRGIKEQEKLFSSEANIILPGQVDDVVPYLNAMDVFVMPSLQETTSLSIMEAMACGTPVITTPVGIAKEHIIEKENGMSFPFRNSFVLSMKIEMLIKNKELRERLGKNARNTIIKNFSWAQTVKGIKNAIKLVEK